MSVEKIEWLPYRPSNGTEGDIFRAGWCDKCEKDRDWRENWETGATGCEIFGNTMVYPITDPKYPKEWRRRADATEWPGAECTAFEPERMEDGISVAVRDELTKDLFA